MTWSTSERRGLLLEGVAQLAGSRLHRLEQPHVLDRDHGLVGEGSDELDLPLAIRSRLPPLKCKDPDRYSVTHQRNA